MDHRLYEAWYNELAQMALYYGVKTGLPERIDEILLAAAELATDRPWEGTELFNKAKEKMQTHVLAQWAKGNALGPPSKRNLEDRARKVESLAKMFERRGELDKAKSQREKAEAIRRGEV